MPKFVTNSKISTPLLILLLIIFAILNLFVGSADIPLIEIFKVLTRKCDNEVFNVIVLENRLPQMITAAFSGAALAVSGLIMQTVFSNPLAGPSVLGISSASSLGVAVVTFLFSSIFMNFNSTFSVIFGSLLGSGTMLMLLVLLSGVVRQNVTMLVVGMMISYICGSLVTILNFFGTEQSVKNFTVWTMGTFAGVELDNLKLFCLMITVMLVMSFLLVKPLNMLLLGENYAQNLGLNITRAKAILLFTSGTLTAIVTAYCGPIAFIGLAVPHICRLIVKTSNHIKVLPFCILVGACTALICNMLCIIPGTRGILPINAVTPIFGIPIIVWIILGKQKFDF